MPKPKTNRPVSQAVLDALDDLLEPGSPVYERLKKLTDTNIEYVIGLLEDAIQEGKNPAVIGKLIAEQGLGIGLTDALRWARTVQMNAYRLGSQVTMGQNSDILDGWVWFALLDSAIPPCESCLANHGKLFSLDESLDDHPNGRCVAIPHVAGDDNPVSQTGADWFDSLDEATQREILGKTKLELLQGGQITFDQLTKQVDDDIWGSIRVSTPLWELLGAEPPLTTK